MSRWQGPVLWTNRPTTDDRTVSSVRFSLERVPVFYAGRRVGIVVGWDFDQVGPYGSAFVVTATVDLEPTLLDDFEQLNAAVELDRYVAHVSDSDGVRYHVTFEDAYIAAIAVAGAETLTSAWPDAVLRRLP